jgi:hypothetical protein
MNRDRSLVMLWTLAGGAAVSLFSLAAQAGDSAHPPLPEIAYTSCASKSAGDACSVAFGDKTVSGTCAASPEDSSRLFCRLSEPPPHPPGDGPGHD